MNFVWCTYVEFFLRFGGGISWELGMTWKYMQNNNIAGSILGTHLDSKALAKCSSRAILGRHLCWWQTHPQTSKC